jgi:hypothetical protein
VVGPCQQGKKLGRPKVPTKVEAAVREHLTDRSVGGGGVKAMVTASWV